MPMDCAELVERVTDYLEGAVGPDELRRIEEHLAECDGCTAHVAQMRVALRLLRTQPPERASPELEDGLAAMFRAWAQ